MKIEHWVARSSEGGQRQKYQWQNLLGVCGGETLFEGRWVEHCDTARGATALEVHPARPQDVSPEATFEFTATPPDHTAGRGLWIRALQDRGQEDIATLNLNAPFIARARLETREEVRALLRTAPRAKQRAVLNRLLRTATVPGPQGLPAYARVVAEYLEGKKRNWH